MFGELAELGDGLGAAHTVDFAWASAWSDDAHEGDAAAAVLLAAAGSGGASGPGVTAVGVGQHHLQQQQHIQYAHAQHMQQRAHANHASNTGSRVLQPQHSVLDPQKQTELRFSLDEHGRPHYKGLYEVPMMDSFLESHEQQMQTQQHHQNNQHVYQAVANTATTAVTFQQPQQQQQQILLVHNSHPYNSNAFEQHFLGAAIPAGIDIVKLSVDPHGRPNYKGLYDMSAPAVVRPAPELFVPVPGQQATAAAPVAQNVAPGAIAARQQTVQHPHPQQTQTQTLLHRAQKMHEFLEHSRASLSVLTREHPATQTVTESTEVRAAPHNLPAATAVPTVVATQTTATASASGALPQVLPPGIVPLGPGCRVLGGRVEKPKPEPRKKSPKKTAIAASALSPSDDKSELLVKELQELASKPKIRRYANPSASRFCHVCARSIDTVRAVSCFNTLFGVCRKIICEKCFAEHGWDWAAAAQPGARWACVHCKGQCPPRAQCNTYKRTNQRRRVKGLERRKQLEQLLLAGGADSISGLVHGSAGEGNGEEHDEQ